MVFVEPMQEQSSGHCPQEVPQRAKSAASTSMILESSAMELNYSYRSVLYNGSVACYSVAGACRQGVELISNEYSLTLLIIMRD